MRNLMKNPELKRSSIWLVIIMILFLCISYVVISFVANQYKKSLIENNAVIVGTILKEHPEWENDVVPLVTKGLNEQEKQAGLKVLQQYGYDKELAIHFIPSVINLQNNLIYIIFGIVIAVFIILFIFNYAQFKSLYRKINSITEVSNDVLEGRHQVILHENEEGEFAKLIYSINNMSASIRNNIMALEKEKKFLVNLLSDISHQLKTPLSSLMMFNELLTEREIEDAQRKRFLKSSQVQLKRMEWLIKSLLKLAKLDAGAIVFKKVDQSLNETISQTIEMIKKRSEEEKVEIKLIESEDIHMAHDREWLSEALMNMIKNAVEHTEKDGCITVSVEDSPLFYRIFISDTGEGIEPNQLPHIFKRFYRIKSRKQNDSVGIGLSLSQSIVEGQGGLIEVDSILGEGTTFQILFPKY